MPSRTISMAASFAAVMSPAPIAAAQARALIGRTPEKSPARSTPSRPIATYQSTKPPTVTTEPR
jgi:hypothetical protein